MLCAVRTVFRTPSEVSIVHATALMVGQQVGVAGTMPPPPAQLGQQPAGGLGYQPMQQALHHLFELWEFPGHPCGHRGDATYQQQAAVGIELGHAGEARSQELILQAKKFLPFTGRRAVGVPEWVREEPYDHLCVVGGVWGLAVPLIGMVWAHAIYLCPIGTAALCHAPYTMTRFLEVLQGAPVQEAIGAGTDLATPFPTRPAVAHDHDVGHNNVCTYRHRI